MQNTFRVNGTMSRENGILMGECPVCKLGWFGIVVAGRQKTISVGRENYFYLATASIYSSKNKKREKKNSRTGRKTCHCTHFAVAASVSFALREKKNCVHGKESYVLLISRWGDIIF